MDAYLMQSGDGFVLYAPKAREAKQQGFWQKLRNKVSYISDSYGSMFKKAQSSGNINIRYSPSLDREYVEKVYNEIVEGEVKRCKRKIAVNTTLTAVAVPVPLPLLSLFFAYLATTTYENLEAVNSMRGKAVFVPFEGSGIEQIVDEAELKYEPKPDGSEFKKAS